MFEKLKKDYAVHGCKFSDLGFLAMIGYRFGVWSANLSSAPLRWLGGKVYGFFRFLAEISVGITINREVKLGEGFHIVHGWNIRIHPEVVIGERCGIMHDVTIGTVPDQTGAPKIGHDVFIGAGAKILGDITVGDNARVAANSLVIADVPPNTTAIGVPARILRYTGREAEEKTRD